MEPDALAVAKRSSTFRYAFVNLPPGISFMRDTGIIVSEPFDSTPMEWTLVERIPRVARARVRQARPPQDLLVDLFSGREVRTLTRPCLAS